ncbi:MAG: O-antigen polymerase [Pelagibacteraceae bacterium]|nr:O-antigen polymerase [Pelagibacteraceae bacterium]PPR51263.1 MAG: hypothetical protein CFH20_00689 [Alphaproteobacteria bacterium MarineAlpha5_Bin10]|tara:strand:+ start:6093 stop:7415 length:1323 start_codon:yes stop_codon:yes gene_type:complete
MNSDFKLSIDSSLKNVQVWLIYLLPLALVTGPFLSDLFAVIASIIFIYFSIKSKQWYYYKNPLIIVFWIWCFYLIVLSLFSDNPLLSLESSLFFFRFGFFTITIWYVLDNNKFFIKKFTWIFIIIFVVVLLDGYLQFFSGKNIFNLPYDDGSGGMRISGFFGEEQILGSYLSRLLPLLFALMISVYSFSKKTIFFCSILIIATDVLIYVSGERVAFFYLLLTTIIILTLVGQGSLNFRWKMFRLFTFLLSLVIIIYISATNSSTKFRMIDKTLDQVNIFDNKESENGIRAFSIQHQVLYISALKMFADHPLTGIGPKMFREKCKESKYYVTSNEDRSLDGCQTHPHNTYIQLLSETGLIGTLPVILVFMYICWNYLKHLWFIIKHKKNALSDYQICLYAALLITLWPLVPTGNFFHNWLNVIYFFPLGFLLHDLQSRGSK